MKNKGFTLVELLAVIVVLGILATIATVSVSRYRSEVSKKELVNLRSTIYDSYDSYRNEKYVNYETPETDVKFTKNIDNEIYGFFDNLTFDGDKLSKDSLEGSRLLLVSKGDLLSNDDYNNNKNDENVFVEDGTCVVEATDMGTDEGDTIHKFDKKCLKEDGKIVPSLEELICIKLVVNGNVKINDFDKNGNSLCRYLEG